MTSNRTVGGKPLGIAEIGVGELPLETRTHVNHDPARHAARTGYLFQTPAWILAPTLRYRPWLGPARVWFIHLQRDRGAATFHTVGGGRDWPIWSRIHRVVAALPALTGQALRRSCGVRLILATPAVFKHGWRPAWFSGNGERQRLAGQPPACR